MKKDPIHWMLSQLRLIFKSIFFVLDIQVIKLNSRKWLLHSPCRSFNLAEITPHRSAPVMKKISYLSLLWLAFKTVWPFMMKIGWGGLVAWNGCIIKILTHWWFKFRGCWFQEENVMQNWGSGCLYLTWIQKVYMTKTKNAHLNHIWLLFKICMHG